MRNVAEISRYSPTTAGAVATAAAITAKKDFVAVYLNARLLTEFGGATEVTT